MSRYDNMGGPPMQRGFGGWIAAGTIFLCFLIATGLVGCPKYNVYSAEMDGKAEYAKAEYSRQVAVLEARAKKDSASELAAAEITRAHGVAQANQIIGDSLKGNESYLRYLWIQSLDQGKNEVIYVPTEANLPILEATRKLQMSAADAAEAQSKEEKKK